MPTVVSVACAVMVFRTLNGRIDRSSCASHPGNGSAEASKTPRAIARATTLAASAPSLVKPKIGSASGLSPGGNGEHDITIKRRVDRINGARQARLRHDRQSLGLRLGQLGVGRHDHQGRAGARAAFRSRLQRIRRKRIRPSAAAELAVLLERRRPKPGTGADQDAAGGIDGGERADDRARRHSAPKPNRGRLCN